MSTDWKDEVVVFDPEDMDTYPSVCAFPEEVERRFGWTGGEEFTHREIERWFDEGVIPKACEKA